MSNGEMAQYNCIVIGAGIVGSATAYSLSRRGCSTLLLDQVGSCWTACVMHNNASILVYEFRILDCRRYLLVATRAPVM